MKFDLPFIEFGDLIVCTLLVQKIVSILSTKNVNFHLIQLVKQQKHFYDQC